MRSPVRRTGAVFGIILLFGAGGAAQAQAVIGNVNIVSDYRYRGVSLSDDKPALQAELTLSNSNGFYGNAWASTISPYGGAREELDLTAGRRFTMSGFAVDATVVAYTYPSAPAHSYLEVPISISRTAGAWTWTGGAAYAPPQLGTNGHANSYGYLKSEWKPSASPVSLTGSFGYENGAFARHKIDWSAGVTTHVRAATLSLSYVGFHQSATEGALVASVGVGFCASPAVILRTRIPRL